MGNPNFSLDPHLSTTYAVISDHFEVDCYYVADVQTQIEKINDTLRFGKLRLNYGHHDGVCIHSYLTIGGNYINSGSVKDALDTIAQNMVDNTRYNARVVEAKNEYTEPDMTVFLGHVVDRLKEQLEQFGFLAIDDKETLLQMVFSANDKLDYDMTNEDQREDLITDVFNWSYWRSVCEKGFEAVIDDMDSAARKIALSNDMMTLSVGSGWGCHLTQSV